MANIQPLRPYMIFTDKQGNLTKEAYEFLFSMFQRVGGSLSNLNAALLQNKTWEAPGTIGFTTPNTGKFTTGAFSGPITSTVVTGTAPLVVASITEVANFRSATTTALANPRTIGGVSFDGTTNITVLTATGPFTVTSGFGCNGKTAQTSYASGGTVATTASTNTAPYGYTTTAQADAIVTKLNNIINALVANGIMS